MLFSPLRTFALGGDLALLKALQRAAVVEDEEDLTEAVVASVSGARRTSHQARGYCGNGRIGSKVIKNLRERGHDAVAADRNTGVNTSTGEGLDSALADAQVVVDLPNSPSFEDAAVLEFFQTSGRNLLQAEVNAGVEHHVALSIVGADWLPDSGYMRAKVAQEQLIEAAGRPKPSFAPRSSSSS